MTTSKITQFLSGFVHFLLLLAAYELSGFEPAVILGMGFVIAELIKIRDIARNTGGDE